MFKIQYTFILVFTLLICHNTCKAQTFSFSDIHPVNNPDSLEAWLTANPTPSVKRLKNMLQLERTWSIGYKERIGKYTKEINQLIDQQNLPNGEAFKCLFTAKRNNIAVVYQNFLAADSIFKAVHDTSGRIYTLVSLARLNYTQEAMMNGRASVSEQYLSEAETLLQKRFNIHDYIVFNCNKFLHIYAQRPIDATTMLRLSKEGLVLTQKNPDAAYNITVFKSHIALAQSVLGHHKEAYQANKEILTLLKPDQTSERVRITLNLLGNCGDLEFYNERADLAQSIWRYMRQNQHRKLSSYKDVFDVLKEDMVRKGDYKQALIFADSFSTVKDSLYSFQRDQKLLELQSQYQDIEKQKQIAELSLQKEKTESRNRFFIALSVAAILVSGLLSFFWFRLKRVNKQLLEFTRTREQFFAIIAHDLRRPFHAFQGMNDMINYYLKKGDYASVEKISKAIDESGLRIRQLLDNLLKWALAQKEEVPYKPETLNLLDEIRSVVSVYNSAFVTKNTRFEVVCADSLTVFADRNALELILRNLISNSLAAINDESGIITVEATPQSNGQIKLTISDNGNGLDAVKTEAFRQVLANPNVGEVGQNGFGFGLVLIAKFAKRNGIAVDFKSQVGEGTAFELILPTS